MRLTAFVSQFSSQSTVATVVAVVGGAHGGNGGVGVGLTLNAASHMGLTVQKHMVDRQADLVLQDSDHVIIDVAAAKKSVLESLPDLGHVEWEGGLVKHVCLVLEGDPDNVLRIVSNNSDRTVVTVVGGAVGVACVRVPDHTVRQPLGVLLDNQKITTTT